MNTNYAGDLLPQEAWTLLTEESNGEVIDVRTDAEWAYVGFPDLGHFGKQIHFLEWLTFPGMSINPDFASALLAKGFAKDQPLLFLCRSGQRSRNAAIAMTAQGFTRCYNIAEGFEGDKDAEQHRGTVSGWKHAGLPWIQN